MFCLSLPLHHHFHQKILRISPKLLSNVFTWLHLCFLYDTTPLQDLAKHWNPDVGTKSCWILHIDPDIGSLMSIDPSSKSLFAAIAINNLRFFLAAVGESNCDCSISWNPLTTSHTLKSVFCPSYFSFLVIIQWLPILSWPTYSTSF